MREITIGDKKMRVRATPLALLFYQQEFKSDLIGDLMKLQGLKKNPSQFDSVLFLKIIWAMAKTDKPKDFPSFEGWLENLDTFDFGDKELMLAVMEEASDGFFRRSRKAPKGKQ